MSAATLDHLVVVAASLDEGVTWCERTLGVTPGVGGEHPLMGTHNRLLRIDTPTWPGAYLEIIAINTEAKRQESAHAKRWFDMDFAPFMASIARNGPQLAHWVARVPDVERAVRQLAQLGIDRGAPVVASRATPHGELRWRITIRPDGARLFDGCLPTLIEWGEVHPVANMAASGIALQEFRLEHPQASLLSSALRSVGLPSVEARPSKVAGLQVTLQTPRGPVLLTSQAVPPPLP